MRTNVRFTTPPEPNRTRRDWKVIADTLRSRPGEWALVARNADRSTAVFIKKARLTAFAPAGSFDAITRKEEGDEGGRASVYARFLA